MPSTEKISTPTPHDDRLTAVLEQLAASQAKLTELQATEMANRPLKTITFAEMVSKEPRREMPFPVFQNGYRLDVDSLTDEQLALLPKLQDGRFFDRKIHVYRSAGPDREWHIDYANKSIEDRMNLKTYARDFTEMLQRLTTETPDLT